jgi:stearoyl-CoA desaturase (Delta-9 desaturase)
MTATVDVERRTPRPDFEEEPSSMTQRVLVGVFVGVPLLAVIAAIPLAWAYGFLSWHDVVIALPFYAVSGLGITVGFHRYFTHGSFKAKTGLRVALAVAGSLAIEGPVIPGSPTTAGTTSTATRKATRTRRGATARTGRRCPRAWSTRT